MPAPPHGCGASGRSLASGRSRERAGSRGRLTGVACVRGDSVNQLIIDSLAAEIERVRADNDFTERAKKLLERDREILDRLAK